MKETKTIWLQGGKAEMAALCQAYARSFERITKALDIVARSLREASQAIAEMPIDELREMVDPPPGSGPLVDGGLL